MRFVAVPIVSLLVLGFVVGCGGDEESGMETAPFEGQPWVLASGIPVPQDVVVVWPSATFDGGTVGGSTGCNRYSAAYTVDGESIEISPIASTRMACPPPADAIEQAYVAAFEKVTGWRLDGEDLVLVGPEDTELRYKAATPVGDWQVTGFLQGDTVTSPLVGTELTTRFGDDGTLSGSGGCNTFSGSYTSGKGAIEIDPPAGTKKACPEPAGVMEQEAAYLAVLPTAVRYRVDGRALELLGTDGAQHCAGKEHVVGARDRV